METDYRQPVEDCLDERSAAGGNSTSPGRLLLLLRRGDGDTGARRGGRRWRRVVQPAVATDAVVDDAEDLPVEQQHRDARNVERTHRRVDDEVGVVERAQCRRLRPALAVLIFAPPPALAKLRHLCQYVKYNPHLPNTLRPTANIHSFGPLDNTFP